MKSYVIDLISALDSHEFSEVAESILQISFIFEKHRGVGKDYMIERRMESFAWSREVASNDFDDTEVVALKSAIIAYIENEPAKVCIVGAISALSALMDLTTKSIFVAALRRFVETDKDALYQAMIGLDNIGEDVFDGNKSKSFMETEKNTQLANKYLARQKDLTKFK